MAEARQVTWTWRYIQPERTLDDTETVVVDLPKAEKISALLVKLKATNVSGGNTAKIIHDLVESFSVIAEGRTPLLSLPPHVVDYIYSIEHGKFPPHVFSEAGDAVQEAWFYLLFGRYLGDPDYLIDTGQYRGVQLKFAWTLDTTYFGSGTGKLEVLALVPSEPGMVSPKGFIRRSTLLSRTTVSGAEHYHELPIGLPYRRVSLRCALNGTALSGILSKIWLRLNEGKIKYFEYNIAEWLALNKDLFPYVFDVSRTLLRADGATVTTPFGEIEEVNIILGTSAAYFLAITAVSGNQYTIGIVDTAGAAVTTAQNIREAVEGYFPWQCLTILDERIWGAPFPSTQFTKVEIAEEEAVSNAVVTPIIEEYAPLKI